MSWSRLVAIYGSYLILVAAISAGRATAQTPALASTPFKTEWPSATYPDLLDLHHEPQSPDDRSGNLFFDQGAWHGYALPDRGDGGTGFAGPFLSATRTGVWAGRRFASVELTDPETRQPLPLPACDGGGSSFPGALVRHACGKDLALEETLFFVSASTTLVRITLESPRAQALSLTFTGEQCSQSPVDGDVLLVSVPGTSARPEPAGACGYRLRVPGTLTLSPHRAKTIYLQQTYLPHSSGTHFVPWSGSPAQAWLDACARWQRYLSMGGRLRPELQGDQKAQRVNVTAIETLLDNWRAPLGDLHHDGLFPSYSNPDFNAFWAWDSWKHAAALAWFAPELAKQQVRALFDFQLANGMIPDKVSRNRGENNLRDSKPPLAAWAVAAIYWQTHDRAFVAEMFDQLARYHSWWYADRDHDRNGLVEYGSTDGTRQAAGWESGMDNAVRFDDAAMLLNHAGAWSLDQESVDLNCYLYREKLQLADMASLLGKEAEAKQYVQDVTVLREKIQRVFFDAGGQYFFDVRLGSQTPVKVFGPEGWIPLLTGVASDEQARAVSRVLSDPRKFNTRLPFPSFAADDARFEPAGGYWRGPVWIDQAVFAVDGLERYGFLEQATAMRNKLLAGTQSAGTTETFRETYNPLTGAGQNSRNFSWSAAEYLLLVHPLDPITLQ